MTTPAPQNPHTTKPADDPDALEVMCEGKPIPYISVKLVGG